VPAGTPRAGGPGTATGGRGLGVVEPLPAVDLLDAVVSGIAGAFFGQ
jgi:hypothetical protein